MDLHPFFAAPRISEESIMRTPQAPIASGFGAASTAAEVVATQNRLNCRFLFGRMSTAAGSAKDGRSSGEPDALCGCAMDRVDVNHWPEEEQVEGGAAAFTRRDILVGGAAFGGSDRTEAGRCPKTNPGCLSLAKI